MNLLQLAEKYNICIVLVNIMKNGKKDYLNEIGGGVGGGIQGMGLGN